MPDWVWWQNEIMLWAEVLPGAAFAVLAAVAKGVAGEMLRVADDIQLCACFVMVCGILWKSYGGPIALLAMVTVLLLDYRPWDTRQSLPTGDG